jgi:hypothetical protein
VLLTSVAGEVAVSHSSARTWYGPGTVSAAGSGRDTEASPAASVGRVTVVEAGTRSAVIDASVHTE